MTPPLPTRRLVSVAVPPSELPAMGDVKYIRPARAYLLRDADGYYVLSAICTHLGCLVEESDMGLQCPCHGSHYDLTGRNLSGPASRPLDHLALSWNDEGNLVIDPNAVVVGTERLPAGA